MPGIAPLIAKIQILGNLLVFISVVTYIGGNVLSPNQNKTDSPDALTDEQIVGRVVAGDLPVFEVLMRRYNQRLFRVARGMVGNTAEAEDVVQESYLKAYTKLDQFVERGRFISWITKIVANEARDRIRKTRGIPMSVDPNQSSDEETEGVMARIQSKMQGTEWGAQRRELKQLLEAAIDELPPDFRAVFVLRAVEQMSVAETASCLDTPAETVKTRYHRARLMLRNALNEQMDGLASDLYSFAGEQCDRIVQSVFRSIAEVGSSGFQFGKPDVE